MMEDRYAAVALKLLPNRPSSIVRFRDVVAKALAAEVDAALARQRAEQFPELAGMEADMGKRRSELEKRERTVADRERVATAREQRLTAFWLAFDAYVAWLDGEGALDDNGRRFDALRTACHALKKEKRT